MHNSIGYGIHTRQVGTFEGVASVTGKGEIMMAVIDKMPFFGDFFELVGLAVLATYTYRYVTDPTER